MRFLSDWCGDIACVKVRASPLLIFYDIFLYSGCQWESDRDPSLIEDYSRLWREGVVISCKPSSLRTLTSLNDTKREEITRHFSPPGISLEVRLSGGSDTNTMLKKYKRKRTVRERIKETLNATDPPPLTAFSAVHARGAPYLLTSEVYGGKIARVVCHRPKSAIQH